MIRNSDWSIVLAAVAVGSVITGMLILPACQRKASPPQGADAALVIYGKKVFLNETFNGNGRTCATCHRMEANYSLTPERIATLPNDDPLFVAEYNPELKSNFEQPELMRKLGLVLVNLDGFDNLKNGYVLRAVPSLLALRPSVNSANDPRTGWSGEGGPGDGSLRAHATGAVIQHFTKTLNRIAGVDYRLPTDQELDALEAYLLSLGRQQDITLPLALKAPLARRGQELFLDDLRGKCNLCHFNGGATAYFGGNNIGNANFDTGIERLLDHPSDTVGGSKPADDGYGTPGDGTFNTPPLVEAADSGPFFHNNAIQTIEGAVAFYNSDTFNHSPAGRVLASTDPNGVGIRLDTTQIESIAAFLRVLNALENIRQSIVLLENAAQKGFLEPKLTSSLLTQALEETDDASRVLNNAGLHAAAVGHLQEAMRSIYEALDSRFTKRRHIILALAENKKARDELIEPSVTADDKAVTKTKE